MAEPMVRPYEPRDRSAIRRICCDTADKGEPMEGFFHDREIFADIVTRYYTDWEPQNSWVAESDGEVVGYLTGCLDTRRYWSMMNRRIVPAAVLRGVFRGALVQPGTWRLARAAFQTGLRGGFASELSLERYPAHFHIDIDQSFRGRHVGHLLLERFIDRAEQKKVPGIHLVTRSDNSSALAFFEKMGFSILSRRPVVFPSAGVFHTHEAMIYGRELNNG